MNACWPRTTTTKMHQQFIHNNKIEAIKMAGPIHESIYSKILPFVCCLFYVATTHHHHHQMSRVNCQLNPFKPIEPHPHFYQPLAQQRLAAASQQQQNHRSQPHLTHHHRHPRQSQFRLNPRLVKANEFISSLNSQSQSYSNQLAQQQQQQQHNNRPENLNQINQSSNHRARGTPVSDRRASSSSSASASLNRFNNQPHQQVPISVSPTTAYKQHEQQQQQQHQDNHGKLLICYYTTRQTAPYWPKDAREFVIPADRLTQMTANFIPSHMGPVSLKSKLDAASSSQVNRFSLPIAGQAHRDQQHHPGASSLFVDTHSNLLALGLTNQEQLSPGHKQPAPQPFAGGRIVVVAPKFVPFNQSILATNNNINNEIALDKQDSLAQMLLMPNNERHNSISNRQDNVATTQTITTNRGLVNQSHFRQSTTPHSTELLASNHDNSNNNAGGGGIVFDQNRSRHDLNNKRDGGGLSAIGDGRVRVGGELQSPQQVSTISSPVLFLSRNNNNNINMNQANNSVPSSLGANDNYKEANTNPNNRDHIGNGAHLKQQLIFSPSLGRSFIVGGSQPPLVTANNNNNDNDNQQLNQNQLHAQNTPMSNMNNNDNSNYYYYYNQPTNPQSSISTLSTATSSGPAAPAATTTVGLAAPTSYRPSVLQQHQQQHELSSTTLANFNSNGNPQRSKSLQAVLDGELPPAFQTSSLPAPVTLMPPSARPPPAYLISGFSGQSQPVDRLIVSSNVPSIAAAHQRQQYSSLVINSANPTGFTPNDLFKFPSSSSDDGLITDGSKTLTIASSLTTSSQLGSSLTSSSLPLSTTSATSPRPIGSSTAPTPSSSQTNAIVVAADELASNRQHQHNNNNNKQTVGLGGNSLQATLVSSPLSTMFDVFGAASQYLMRFKPSSLMSPSSFASLSNAAGDHSSLALGHHQSRVNSSSSSPSLFSSGSSTSLLSLPFASGPSGLHQKTANSNDQSPLANNSISAAGSGFLTRLSLQGNQRREGICGRTIQTPERRIIGGEGARYGEFPYQVHIKIAKHQCGGALVDKQSIVTAAHCVYHFITRAPVSKLQIVIGAYDIEDEQYQELPPQYFKVNKVKLHPNFRFSASHPDRYDIAILKLDKPVKYTDNVLPVCLPGKDLKFENMVGTVTGFGKTDPSLTNRYGTRLLQKVDVPIIENSECERWHRTRGIDLKIFPEMMCAGYEDGLKDACVGDSGGPLVVKTPVGSNGSFRWTLAGITSAGFGCAQSRQPGIYHRVSHTVDWILENLD